MSSCDLPVVDISMVNIANVRGNEASTMRETDKLNPLADVVVAALEKYGMCYLKNHGLSPEKIKHLRKVSREVFDLPENVKKGYARRDDALYHGYVTADIERHKDVGNLEQYETFMVNPANAFAWPDEVPGFKPASLDVFYEFQELSNRMFDLLGVGLGLKDRGYIHRSHRDDSADLRNTLYRSYPDDFVPGPKQLRFFEHYDVGTISFVYQDSVGGLEWRTESGEWKPVPYIPDTVILLTGKLMQRWTSDRLKAVFHRVVIPDDQAARQTDRQSLIFFPLTDDDFVFRCLDGSDTYEPVSLKDFCAKNIYEANYVDV